ncbi:ABC transporter substrate-binding protein [Streptomyces sulfonofaciens]|uniref:ABC transporter substrate-binding protein n=1 Tax=Streptomyces sulfonofaciens TaxID=68272 RepID=A0A919G0H9_9ACTN|nr:ABC transporter substrate-binding protein [Streptomyces sulfonofaciens]GHH74985.1 ABC transporter substrate-binding protein [Streptomyces sulfonofaciens]
MSTFPAPGRRLVAAFALCTAAALAFTACGFGGAGAPGAGPAARGSRVPTADVVSSVHEDEAAARLLPADVRRRGTLTIATSVGSAPGATYLDDGRTIAGQDVDFADAAARVLGLRLKRQAASFEAILPALESGKFDLGTGNFGVTDERRRTIDFVTYINDGQGFAARADSGLERITNLDQLCGLTVSTGAGTTFEATLEDGRKVCESEGRKPYTVQTYADSSAIWSSLQQGRTDVTMGTINGLRYAIAEQQGFRFLGEYRRLDVGFAFRKGTPLAPAFQAAVDRLLTTGTYRRILRKWGTTGSAIERSRISPPEVGG